MTLQWERGTQDGYAFRTVKVRESDTEPEAVRTSSGTAMGSTLTITFKPDADDDEPDANRRRTQ